MGDMADWTLDNMVIPPDEYGEPPFYSNIKGDIDMATKTKTNTKGNGKTKTKTKKAPIKATPTKKTSLRAAIKPVDGTSRTDVFEMRTAAPPCPEPEAAAFQSVLDALNAPLATEVDDPSADSDAHFTRTPLVDIPEFAAATARYDLVRSYVKALEEIKDRLSGDLKTWMGLGGLEATVAMGFKLETVTTERKTFDRDRAVTVAHLTEEQIEASMKVSKSTQLRVTQLKPQVEEAQ